jgi:choline dehydrogenase
VMMYPTERKLDGSTFYSLAGRIMGGGSSVNVMSAPRPMKCDFDAWVAHGNPDWAYDNLLPVLRRIESDQDFPDSPIHGSEGPLYLKRQATLDSLQSEAADAFISRALSLGLPLCSDANGPEPLGICAMPFTVKDGQRQSTTVAYLDPARGRPNLRVIADALTLRLNVQGRRVRGVVYEQDGRAHTATADKVVLSAGVYHSPQLLMLSGIGPPRELERVGIPVVHALEGVGENYQDHAVVYLTFEGPTHFEAEVVPRFRLIVKSDPSRACPNIHVINRAPTEVPGLRRMLPMSVHLVEQRNRGRVSLASADPHVLPVVDARLLEDPADVETMTAAMRFAYDLVHDDSLKSYYGPLLTPSRTDDWAHFARTTCDSFHHGAGTCMMGPAENPRAAVGQDLRVHGLDNLWVADASILPTVPHAETNLTCIMVGERAADLVRAAD